MTGPAAIPPKGQTPLATGPMSPAGSTTVVKIATPQLDASDKKVLCSAMCRCQNQPNIGVDGQSLKQVCVSGQLKALDAELFHRSEYKPEVTYDMTKRPPQPIMDRAVETKSRDLWPGWTKSLWPKDTTRPTPYKPNRGYTRRPDVVIVKDPLKPPAQGNIKQVIELKFPGDGFRQGQREDYIVIAGDETKMVPLKLEDCDCNESEPKNPKIPVEQLGAVAAILGIIYTAVMHKPPPGGVPAF